MTNPTPRPFIPRLPIDSTSASQRAMFRTAALAFYVFSAWAGLLWDFGGRGAGVTHLLTASVVLSLTGLACFLTSLLAFDKVRSARETAARDPTERETALSQSRREWWVGFRRVYGSILAQSALTCAGAVALLGVFTTFGYEDLRNYVFIIGYLAPLFAVLRTLWRVPAWPE